MKEVVKVLDRIDDAIEEVKCSMGDIIKQIIQACRRYC